MYAPAGRESHRTVDRGVENAEGEFAGGYPLACRAVIDHTSEQVGQLGGGQVDGDALDEFALHMLEELDILDIEAQVGVGETPLPLTGDEYGGAGYAEVVEAVIGVAEEHELGASREILDLEYTEWAVASLASGEVDHHASELELRALDGSALGKFLDGATHAVIEFHPVGVEGMGREIHAHKLSLLLEPDGHRPL